MFFNALARALRSASGAAASASRNNNRKLSDGFYSSPALKLAAAAAVPFSRSLSSTTPTSTLTTSTSTPSSSSVLPPSARSDFAYCADLVRKNDPENYLWVMELPKPQRAVALALRAFNVETAMAADSASAHSRKEGVPSFYSSGGGGGIGEHQRALASARLLWWKEAVAAACGSVSSSSTAPSPPPDHPVARALAAVAASGAVSARSLSARLSRVASARADDAAFSDVAPFATMRDLESYGEATAAQLLYLQLEASGSRNSADVDHAASHLGRAATAASLLRGTFAHATGGRGEQQRRCYLPLSELEAAGTSPEELFAVVDSRARARESRRRRDAAPAPSGDAGGDSLDDGDPFFFPDSLRVATRAVASAALSHLSAARRLRERFTGGPSSTPKCFLQAVGVARYLSLLEDCGFDPLSAEEAALSLGTPAARARYRAGLALRTKWCSWGGTY